MVDDFGRVFFYKNKVYRGIYPNCKDQCLALLKSPLFNELSEKGYIPITETTDLEVPGYSLVLEHEKLLEIQQHEWSFQMLKDSALMVLEINKICNKYGYELKDAHTFNVLFRGSEPVYVDIGSISIKKGKDWIAYNEFICVFYLPLAFWAQKEYIIVRKLVESLFYRMQIEPSQDILDSALQKLLRNKPFNYIVKFRGRRIIAYSREYFLIKLISKVFNRILSLLIRKVTRPLTFTREIKRIEYISKKISDFNLPEVSSLWNDYHKQNYTINQKFEPSKRFNRIIELISKKTQGVETVIDLAGNEGYLSRLIVEKLEIKKVILCDYDSNVVNNAYQYLKEMRENFISTALLNFMFTINIEGTAERLKSDLVLALAVTHHLVLGQNYSIDVVFERLKMFSKHYVFVEFMPLGLWSSLTRQGPVPPEWYTIEWFKHSFQKHFQILLIEELEENRVLFIGEKR
jgi:hypothetical protein